MYVVRTFKKWLVCKISSHCKWPNLNENVMSNTWQPWVEKKPQTAYASLLLTELILYWYYRCLCKIILVVLLNFKVVTSITIHRALQPDFTELFSLVLRLVVSWAEYQLGSQTLNQEYGLLGLQSYKKSNNFLYICLYIPVFVCKYVCKCVSIIYLPIQLVLFL